LQKPIAGVTNSTREKKAEPIGPLSDNVQGKLPDLKTKIVVYSLAEEEFSECLSWYAERSMQAAADFDREFDAALATISSNPERFPNCDTRHQFYLMRIFPIQIIFRHLDTEIHIVAVAHTSRKPKYWTGR